MKPREKYESRGIESLSELELTAILIASGTKDYSYDEIAKSVLALLRKSMPGGRVDLDELSVVRGLGRAKSMQVLAGIELGRRLYNLYDAEKVRVVSTKESIPLFDDIKYRKREYLKAVYLNARFELVHKEIISMGRIDAVFIQPRDILLPALERNALYIVMAHNHPSGTLEPSPQDIDITNRVGKAAKEMGFVLLDHVVVSKRGWRRVVSSNIPNQ